MQGTYTYQSMLKNIIDRKKDFTYTNIQLNNDRKSVRESRSIFSDVQSSNNPEGAVNHIILQKETVPIILNRLLISPLKYYFPFPPFHANTICSHICRKVLSLYIKKYDLFLFPIIFP